MKAVLLLLAVLAVAVGPAHALLCHVCTSVTNCEHPQTCPSSFQYCKTTTTRHSLAPLGCSIIGDKAAGREPGWASAPPGSYQNDTPLDTFPLTPKSTDTLP
ncbi:Lymphocyte antigen 6D [Tupaia chinensis]|uniref:Lymphocyte antigen 6D n=1 Tax=Tupaia chinensis TaxID=246437 RepID=L9KLR5_TUPCH|nr:Lymphocyte antigen 6D [Tupaia chinensis]